LLLIVYLFYCIIAKRIYLINNNNKAKKMTNLIIGIIAIALVLVIAGATMYYIDGAAEQGIEAEAVKLRNEASQISAAVRLYTGDGNTFGENFRIETLVEMGYLKSLPENWEPGEDKIMHVLDNPLESERVCFTANRQAGYTFDSADSDVITYSTEPQFGIPLCNKPGLGALVPCCTD
jgi:hypothetical protein